MGKVLAAFEELGKPILWGMGWVNRRLGSFGGHPILENVPDLRSVGGVSQPNFDGYEAECFVNLIICNFLG